MEKNFLDKRLNNVGARAELVEVAAIFAVLLAACLVLPILLYGNTGFLGQNNQFIAGPIVNCALILAALNFRGVTKNVGVICMPSALAVSVGFIGFMGVYAMYMIPAIWLGNAVLCLGFKYLHVHKKINFAVVAAVVITLKIAIIFGIFNIFAATGAIPAGAASAMALGFSLYQLITASAGCLLAFGIVKLFYRRGNQWP